MWHLVAPCPKLSPYKERDGRSLAHLGEVAAQVSSTSRVQVEAIPNLTWPSGGGLSTFGVRESARAMPAWRGSHQFPHGKLWQAAFQARTKPKASDATTTN